MPTTNVIRASDVMTRDVATVREDLPIAKLLEMLPERGYSGFPVVDGDGRAVGLISQNDVLRALAYAVAGDDLPPEFQAGRRRAATHLIGRATPAPAPAPDAAARGSAVARLLGRPVRDVMTPSVEACAADAPVADVCETMARRRIHRVVVLDRERRVAGIIAALDLVRRFGAELRGA